MIISKPKTKKDFISVIIPICQQERTIKKDLRQIDRTLSKTRFDYEIVGVIDGKDIDYSYRETEKLHLKNLRVVGYPHNHGKGYAVRYGMARSRGNYVVFIDAGMDIDPNGISMILEHMIWYEAGIIVGSKRHPASQVNYPLARRIYSSVYHWLIRILFGIRVTDTQAGLKVFKREVLEKVLPRLLVKRFAFDVELLAVAYHLGFKEIYEAPIKLNRKRFQFSSTIDLNDIYKTLWDTIAVFYRLKILKYYDDRKRQKWQVEPELKMRINTREIKKITNE